MDFQKPRYPVAEARALLGIGHVKFYKRVKEGRLKLQKDGRSSYVTAEEIARYVAECDQQVAA